MMPYNDLTQVPEFSVAQIVYNNINLQVGVVYRCDNQRRIPVNMQQIAILGNTNKSDWIELNLGI